MMTDEQMEKAKQALKDVRSKKLTQQIALHRRQHCLEAMKVFCLPYRVLYDHRGADPDERPLNKYYPLPGLPRDEADQAGAVSIRTEDDARYFCTRFIRYEDFDRYEGFDFTGQILQGEALEAVRASYKARQDDYRRNPSEFWSHIAHPNKKAPDDMERYYCFYDLQP